MPSVASPIASPREGSPDSAHSAHNLQQRALGRSQVDSPFDSDNERQPATQATIVEGIFAAANDDAEAEEKVLSSRKAGRTEGALAWSGTELRALLVSMQAHNVFDPTFSPDRRAQSWLAVVEELNQWNKDHPRRNGKFAVRTVDACDCKWRKQLYKAIKTGENASKIVSGPSEDDDAIMDICQQLKDQREQSVKDEETRRNAKRKAKQAPPEKARDARQRASDAIARGLEITQSKRERREKRGPEEDDDEEGGGEGDDDWEGDDGDKSAKTKAAAKTPRRLRARQSDAASAELTAAVSGMAAKQVEEQALMREQAQQHHDERMRHDDKVREMTRQHHKDMLAKEHRPLDIQERQLAQRAEDGGKVAALEEQVKQLVDKNDKLFSFLKEKLG